MSCNLSVLFGFGMMINGFIEKAIMVAVFTANRPAILVVSIVARIYV